jgi:hypothetical protein
MILLVIVHGSSGAKVGVRESTCLGHDIIVVHLAEAFPAIGAVPKVAVIVLQATVFKLNGMNQVEYQIIGVLLILPTAYHLVGGDAGHIYHFEIINVGIVEKDILASDGGVKVEAVNLVVFLDELGQMTTMHHVAIGGYSADEAGLHTILTSGIGMM